MFENIKSKVLTHEELKEFREHHQDKKIVFCTGCYDILQTGHAIFFNQCKVFGDILVVGVGLDNTIRTLKGLDRPVNPEINRLYLIAAMEDVDNVLLNDQEIFKGKIDFKQILEELRPNIFILNDDDNDLELKTKLCNKLGIQIQFVSRKTLPELEPTSTTSIIEKINFAYKSPLRIDFAGGWTDIPHIIGNHKGYVSNMSIKPHISLKNSVFNFSGYPRGSGLSTSTATEMLKMISTKTYNTYRKNLKEIAEDLFTLENKELKWSIGRQDQYSIVYGGYNCFEFGHDYGHKLDIIIDKDRLHSFKERLLLLHTGISRSAQCAVKEVYQNYQTDKGHSALNKLRECGKNFSIALQKGDFKLCAQIMNENFEAQKQLAPSSSNQGLETIYDFALNNGAIGGKICGAGGGGAFIFYCTDKEELITKITHTFPDCFEIAFDIEFKNIKLLNNV